MPSASPVRVTGEVQVVQAPPSKRHSTTAPASSTVKVTVPVVSWVRAAGWPVIVTTGACASMLHVRLTSGPALPAASVARTRKV